MALHETRFLLLLFAMFWNIERAFSQSPHLEYRVMSELRRTESRSSWDSVSLRWRSLPSSELLDLMQALRSL